MASTTKKKSSIGGLMWALLATLVGIAMVAGGVYGLVAGGEDDNKTDVSAKVAVPSTSPDFSSIGAVDDCSDVDPRLADRKELNVLAAQGGGGGTIAARCGGDTVFF